METPIIITVWKDSGKYYTHDRVMIPAEYNTFEDRFKQFVWKHRGATCSGGFITVQDAQDAPADSGFHFALFRTDEMMAQFGNKQGPK